MKKYLGVILALVFGVVGLSLLLVGAIDSLQLLFLLSLMYLPILYFGQRTRNVILKYFLLALLVVNVVSPVLFFLNREHYSYSGWSAVKNFDFSVFSYLGLSASILFFLCCTTIFVLGTQKYFIRDTRFPFIEKRNQTSREVKNQTTKPSSSQKGKKIVWDIFFFSLICLFLWLHDWMFRTGIAITGLIGGQDALPFKLAGMLYYFTRFGIPIILFLVLRNTSRSVFVIIVSVTYAALAGLSQVSRTTFTLDILPILYYVLLSKKYFHISLLAVVFLFLYSTMENGRYFVYAIVDNNAVKGFSGSLFELASETFAISWPFDWLGVAGGIVDRIGGAQNIVLAGQFDTEGTGGSVLNFLRIYGGLNLLPDTNFQEALYGFTPPFGFAVGSGGTCSEVLQVSGGNPVLIVFLSVFFALILLIAESLRVRISKLPSGQILSVVFALLFLALLIALGNFLWLYAFLGLSFLAYWLYRLV